MNIERPIVFFDLETTGINIAKDRIVQIGAIKITPEGDRLEKDVIINPTIPIPKAVSKIHGIRDEDVQDQPTFQQIAKSLYAWLEGCDLAGWNSDNFDVPLLSEEFARVGIDYPTEETLYLDIIRVERLVNGHSLGATYERYMGKKLENAHNAIVDVKATLAVFEKQVEQHSHLQIPVPEIKSLYKRNYRKVDFARKMYREKGEIYWNFGKHKGKLVKETPDYAKWVLNSEFTLDTKKHIRKVFEQHESSLIFFDSN